MRHSLRSEEDIKSNAFAKGIEPDRLLTASFSHRGETCSDMVRCCICLVILMHCRIIISTCPRSVGVHWCRGLFSYSSFLMLTFRFFATALLLNDSLSFVKSFTSNCASDAHTRQTWQCNVSILPNGLDGDFRTLDITKSRLESISGNECSEFKYSPRPSIMTSNKFSISENAVSSLLGSNDRKLQHLVVALQQFVSERTIAWYS